MVLCQINSWHQLCKYVTLCSGCTIYSILLHTAVSGVGLSLKRGTSESSQVLVADVPSVFSRGTTIFLQPTYWPPVSYEIK